MANYNSARSASYNHQQVVKLQLLMAVLCSIIAVFSWNLYLSLSVLIGALLVIVPTLVYIKVSKINKVLPVNQVFARHQKAELFKFFSNLFGFALVFIVFKKVHVLALFATYVVTLSSYWLSLCNFKFLK